MRILFKHGILYDGSIDKPRVGDLLVDGDRIAAMGSDIKAEADRVIDCTGLSISPGWIDSHSHNDFFYDRDRAEDWYAPFLRQGITTQVTGNCGFSVFGVAQDSPYKQDVGGGLFRAENPGSFADFRHQAEGQLYVNMAPLVGHSTVRTSVSGLSPRKLTAPELDRELALAEEALDGGAFGGSFGFMYEPGMYAPKDELIAFAKKVAAHDGILTVHPRACSKVAMGYPLLSKPHIELALDEVIDIARQSGVRCEYSHLIFVGETSWQSADRMLEKFYQARREGIDIAYDNYSFLYGASVITVICPPWYMALPKAKRHSAINRMKLRVVVDVTRKALGIDYEDITVAYINDHDRQYEGRTVAEIAKSEGCDPLDLYLRLIDLSDGKGSVYLGKYYNDFLVTRLMKDDLSVFMTDAWYEPMGIQNGAAYQGFPNFIVRAKAAHIPTEHVIHKMTVKSAERFRLKDRGRLEVGCFADVTVFSEARIKVDVRQPDFTPIGIPYVMVNGVLTVDNGDLTHATPGHVLTKA